MLHQPACKSIEEHVELELAAAHPLPRLPDFVAECCADWAAERSVAADIALADIYGIHRDWTEAELRYAGGDR